ncbi:hypothetical protein H696_03197 [Fonticula alba]|uniref:Trafficking protein particle complex subunit n=1 Tax=Fonticula alba TaxID=691883 RepID=A0A058Z986_FONAL|nr:hypothetical protein H696_03197 [Fonticula alba]KCV70840.1 hypothetical protein H696_03197 [Fonticula alba]|eukprot:XP_009495356.1 hypothetical protein H696_03197 [Fonticula alba]
MSSLPGFHLSSSSLPPTSQNAGAQAGSSGDAVVATGTMTPGQQQPTAAAAAQMRAATAAVAAAAAQPTRKNPAQRSVRKGPNIYGRVSLAALAFLFSEIVKMANEAGGGIEKIEQRLFEVGYSVGIRAVELAYIRGSGLGEQSTPLLRSTTIVEILQIIQTVLFPMLYGTRLGPIERDTSRNHYYLIDDDPVVSQFISVPADMKDLNCGAYNAGIIAGFLERAQFPASVSAHNHASKDLPSRTVYMVMFEQSVHDRCKRLESGGSWSPINSPTGQ